MIPVDGGHKRGACFFSFREGKGLTCPPEYFNQYSGYDVCHLTPGKDFYINKSALPNPQLSVRVFGWDNEEIYAK